MSLKRVALACVVACFVVACSTGTEGPTPTSLTVSPSPVPLTSINQTQQLTAAVKDQNGATMSGFTFTYSSNATGVATVSASGLVTAVAPGSATITVSAAGFSTPVTVTVTQAPAALTKVSGDAQSAIENSALPNPLRVKVADALGSGVAGIALNFTISGGGTLNDSSVTTGSNGEAQVTWTLGASGQAQSVTASATGLTSVTFTATAASASAMTIQKFVGDAQTALVGNPTNLRPAVRITNTFSGQPVQGVNVTFAVTGGGGSIAGSTTIATNANGVAQVDNWAVGPSAGANTMTATGSGTFSASSSVTFTATAQAKQYNIIIRPMQGAPAFSASVQAALDAAEAFWENAVYGDIADIATGNVADACGFGPINETVDDLVILADFDNIDGAGQILGSAGPCLVHQSTYLTAVGVMRFDTSDLNTMTAPELNAVILHEMGHIIGFNSATWNNGGRSCAQNLSSGSAGAVTSLDTHFSCTSGREVFDSIGGTSYTGGLKVPLENCASGVPSSCGPGNYNSHWRETVFDHELMTAYLDVGTSVMSRLSLATFIDNGYRVNLAGSQPYSRIFTAPSAYSSGRVIDLGNDQLQGPIYVLDGRGGILRTVPR